MNVGDVLLQGKTKSNLIITIRTLTNSDITPQYCNWLNDKETNQYLESRFTEWNIQSLLDYFYEKNKSELMLAIIDNDTGIHIGNIKVSEIDKHHHRAEIGIIIGDKNSWGKGIATTAIGIVADYCFNTLNLHKLTAGAYAENLASINAFINNGFIVEGKRKEHVLTPSGWSDVVLLGKTKPQE
ncbi:GNAT family N-acetyltransferase [Aeromonas simiae]|uniref:GNAT family N-acetyltransferase n=1 Tax=Aeromonas simiae TaxID=218936 RepID=A0A5J6WY51_9GAMM|nr:GNAT family protein [Aeromonas simiae]QFI54235.1 GNAT family N-acetyltransferase [Aeromonas simiae]